MGRVRIRGRASHGADFRRSQVMTFLRKLKYLLPSYRRALERDMREELEALAEIRGPRELGNISRAAEEARAVWSWTWFEQFCPDVPYASRPMPHNPGFTPTPVLSP